MRRFWKLRKPYFGGENGAENNTTLLKIGSCIPMGVFFQQGLGLFRGRIGVLLQPLGAGKYDGREQRRE